MTDEKTQVRKLGRWLVIGFGLFLVAGMFVSLLGLKEKLKPIPETEVELATVEFENGHRFVVHRLQLVDEMTIQGPKAEAGSPRLVQTTGSSTYGFGEVDLATSLKNDAFESARLICKGDWLILLGRMFDDRGLPLSTDICSFKLQDYGSTVELSRDSNGLFERANSSKEQPSWILEVGDGADGWREMSGPLIPFEPGARGFFIAAVVPRSDAELTFQVTFEGESKTFQISNPEHGKTVPSWTADLGETKELGEVAVSVQSVGMVWVKEKSRPRLNLELHPRIDQKPDAWEVNQVAMSDPLGNRVPNGFEFLPLPEVEQVRFTYRYEESNTYRWPESGVSVFGELIWPEDESQLPVKATLTKEAVKAGIKSISVGKHARQRKNPQNSQPGRSIGKLPPQRGKGR